MFEPLGGVRNYIQQRRLTRAYQTICDPAHARERVSAISARYGFTNDSVFSRAFRDAYGMSPSDMRATAQAGYADAIDAPLTDDGSYWAVNRWLLGLTRRRAKQLIKKPGPFGPGFYRFSATPVSYAFGAASDAVSILTPGPMVEESATRLM